MIWAGYRGDGLRGNRNAYKADYHKEIIGDTVPEPKWHPSIHMSKQAARIWLKVTDVRVEQLQNITIEGCERERDVDVVIMGIYFHLWNCGIPPSKRQTFPDMAGTPTPGYG